MSILFDDAQNEYLQRSGTFISGMPFTMACWFKSNDDTLRQGLMSLYLSASHYYLLEIRGNEAGDKVYLTIVDAGGGSAAFTTTGYTANQWHHACAVFTSTTNRAVYIDGGSKATSSVTRNPDTPNTLGIGRIITTNYMSGQIGEAAIWSVALADWEVALLAQGFTPMRIQSQNLKGYWPLFSLDHLSDYAGNQNPFTAYNTPANADQPPVRTAFGFDYEWRGAYTVPVIPGALNRNGPVLNPRNQSIFKTIGKGAL